MTPANITAGNLPPKAPFITFEGGEGAGKSTQMQRLADRLAEQGIPVLTTREPGGTPDGEALRGLLMSGAADRWGATAETLLMYAGRAEHLRQKIVPALKARQWVLCDRFHDSTEAYQGAGKGGSTDFLAALNGFVVGPWAPALTLILDLPVGEALARMRARPDAATRFDALDPAFHTRVAEAFRAIAAREPERCVLIDASGPEDAVAERIWAAVTARFAGRPGGGVAS